MLPREAESIRQKKGGLKKPAFSQGVELLVNVCNRFFGAR